VTPQGLCDEYAGLLGLKDWDLTCRLAEPGEIREGNVGQLDWSRAVTRPFPEFIGQALILIEPSKRHDHEVTIAHELCHIPLITCPPRGKRQAQAQELAIDQFARAMVSLARLSRIKL
jgi:hypothetical protein